MEIPKISQKSFRYNPVMLNRIAILLNIYAWFNLVLAILSPVIRLYTLDSRIKNGQANFLFITGNWWDWQNLISIDVMFEVLYPIFTESLYLVGSFLLFKSISIGLNVLLEIDFNQKSELDGGQNE